MCQLLSHFIHLELESRKSKKNICGFLSKKTILWFIVWILININESECVFLVADENGRSWKGQQSMMMTLTDWVWWESAFGKEICRLSFESNEYWNGKGKDPKLPKKFLNFCNLSRVLCTSSSMYVSSYKKVSNSSRQKASSSKMKLAAKETIPKIFTRW